MRTIAEALRGRVKVSEVVLPVSDPKTAVVEAVKIFDTHIKKNGGSIEVKDPFGKWKPIEEEKIGDEIGEHVDTAVRNSKRLDACRGITGIQVIVYSAPLSVNMAVAIGESTRLGDGAPSYTWGRWAMTQIKGEYHNTALLEIRHKENDFTAAYPERVQQEFPPV